MKILFTTCLLTIAYHYAIFPLIVFLASRTKNATEKYSNNITHPTVSLIISAYNEERIIKKKIENSLNLDYPREKLEIIVVSDGSTDSTPDIANEYAKYGVVSLFDPPRRGKTAALNHAAKYAHGDILIFSDANSMYNTDAIKKLVRNFRDDAIGGVCGRKSILKNESRESSKGDSLFWNFESRFKTWQSKAGSISNADGEIFAIRRELYKEIPIDIINDDQFITFNLVRAGYRVVYEPEAVSTEEASIAIEDDFRVKARMVAGGYQITARELDFLFPPRNFFAIQFISHKLIRYLMPILNISLFTSNMFILHGWYKIFFITQLLFYTASVIGYFAIKTRKIPNIFYFPFYYTSMNTAALVGLYYFIISKNNISIWKKAER